MPFSKAGQLARAVRSARLDDPIGLVAENLRDSPHGVLPVLDREVFDENSERRARVVGLVTSADLSLVTKRLLETPLPETPLSPNGHAPQTASTLASPLENVGDNAPIAPKNSGVLAPSPQISEVSALDSAPIVRENPLETLRARDVMRADVPFIPAVFSLHNALLTLERYGFSALPVVDDSGQYLGLVSGADLVSALGQSVRPPLVGGMATPFGVYLTDGRLSGGARGFSLVLSGLLLAFCVAFSQVLLGLGAWLLNPEWGAMAFSGRVGALAAESGGLFNSLATIVQGVLFLGLIRLSPIAGFHAAEHQTVHALERGLPLTVQNVEKMPRAHPRCGTNLTALAGLLLIGFQHLRDVGPESILPVFIFAFFFWRSMGTFLQEVFTTRPATKKQLENGIAAAQELLQKYQAQPFAEGARPFRLLNGGMISVALGMFVGLLFFQIGLEILARSVLGG